MKNVYWMYGILIEDDFGLTAKEVMDRLGQNGIETRAFFVPMHMQPVFKKDDKRFPDISGKYPVSEELSRKGLYLPQSSSLSEKQIEKVANSIKNLQK